MAEQHQKFGPFLVIRPLGRGGMGEVYIARTTWDENPLAAVKRLRPDVARVPTFSERFKHEADLAVRLQHPNIVGTIDVGSVDGQLYVASELVYGKDTGIVADRLRERGQGAPAAVVVRLLLDILSGLAYVHGAREPDGRWLSLVHRDVTPGNVLIGYDGVGKLADFGLAKSALTERANLTNQGEILGTPHYLAPEVIRGDPAGPPGDIYGVGAVMYRVLTGVAPHQGTTAEVLFKALTEKPRSLTDLRPDLAPWFVSFIHRMMEPDVTKRPFDAALLARQLEHEAKRANLLLPHASVGRWLKQLFAAEHDEENDERRRLLAIDPASFGSSGPGTVVLARVVKGTELDAPSPIAEESGDDVRGTELELGDAPRGVRKLRRDATGGGKTIDSGQYEQEEMDALPTYAIQIDRRDSTGTQGRVEGYRSDVAQKNGTVPDERAPDHELLENVTRSLDPSDPRDPSNSDGELPGFVEAGAGRGSVDRTRPVTPKPTFPPHDQQRTAIHSVKPTATAGEMQSVRPTPNTDPPPVRARPKNPGSVVVAPVAISEGDVAPPEHPPFRVIRVADPMQPVARSDLVDKPAPRREVPPPAVTGAEVEVRRGFGGVLAPIALSVSISIALGVAIGLLISRSQEPETVRIAAAPQSLVTRFNAVRKELEARGARGEPVPPRAWAIVGEAAAAFFEGDEEKALARVTEIEKLMAELPPSAPQ